MEFICLIPARSGSKGIKDKNIISIGNENLIERAYKFALKVISKDKIVISSDYDFETFSSFLDKSKYRKRPKLLSNDHASIIDVCIDTFEYFSETFGKNFTDLILIQPTSPLRNSSDLENAINLYKKQNLKSLASVSPVIQHPYEIIKGHNHKWSPLLKWEGHKNRQSLDNFYYFINGCFYIMNLEYLKSQKKIVNKNTFMFLMNQKYIIDIDDYEDLNLVKKILK